MDFHLPGNPTPIRGVRAAVDFAAPGENFVVAAYLGDSGSLDDSTGAGALDLESAYGVYFEGTTGLGDAEDGVILATGWDLGTIGTHEAGETVTYPFASAFTGDTQLTISLNWFADRAFDDTSNLGSSLSFTNLDLEVWMYGDEPSPTLVAKSVSVYNNAEFLRITLANPGSYGITVVDTDMISDLTSGGTSETFGLAWQAVAIPEPSAVLVAILGGGLLLVTTRRRVACADR